MNSEMIIPQQPIALSIEQDGMQIETFETLKLSFNTLFDKAEGWRKKALEMPPITSIEQKREMKLFRESRLALRELRIEVENKRKTLKEDSLRRGKAIDGIANVFKALVVPIEEYLGQQEEFADRFEANRIKELSEKRFTMLSEYGDASCFTNLGTMEDEAFSTLLDNLKLAKQAREDTARKIEQERIEREAAELAEQKRLAELQRQEAARIEQERQKREEELKAAKLKAEKELKAVQDKALKERAAADARLLQERQEAEAKAAEERKIRDEEQNQMAAQASKERAELMEKNRIASEKAKADRAEYEAKLAQAAEAQKAFERKAAQEKEAQEAKSKAESEARKKLASAPNKAKLEQLSAAIAKLEIPILEGKEEIRTEIQGAVNELITLVNYRASKL